MSYAQRARGGMPHPVQASVAAVAALALACPAQGADLGPWSLSASVGAVSDYVSRGLTQTWGKPALQAELEAEHDAGFYAGAFVSNVSRNEYPGGSVETQLWLGYEYEFAADAALSAEATYFAYPGANFGKGVCAPAPACPDQSFNTAEGRLAARWRWLSARFAYAFSDYFGAAPTTGYQASTRGTWYAELNGTYPLPGHETWELGAHVGRTRYSARYAYPDPAVAQDPSYWDWRLSLTKTFNDSWGAWRVGAYYTQASNASFYDNTRSLTNGETFNLGRPTVLVGVARTLK